MNAVRVGFISSHSQRGGSERVLRSLVTRLEDPWVGRVVCLQDGPFVADLRGHGMSVDVVPTSAGPWAILRSAVVLRRHLNRAEVDLVHANGVKAALTAVIASLGERWPVVWLKHDFSWDGWLGRLVARRCRLVVGVSSSVLRSLEGVTDVRVVHPGIEVPSVDTVSARTHLRDAFRIGVDGPVLVVIGRLDPVKGQHEAIKTMPSVLRVFPSARLLVIGGEDPSRVGYLQRLELLVDDLGLGQHVTFTGHREDAVQLLAGADVALVTTGRDERGTGEEGFGLVAVEAMAVGTPVVAYETGALGEVIGDAGILVRSGDPVALGDAIRRVLSDPVLRTDLQRAGQDRASMFNMRRMLDEMRTIYLTVAASPH